jgi:predicted ATP-dependent endonuclease of OLD family
MKISKLHIEEYKHLENLEFDFTYQTGERKGQPLDKICFIGQSATGKTNLLELLFSKTKQALNQQVVSGYLMPRRGNVEKELKSEIIINFKKNKIKFKNDSITYNDKVYEYNNVGGSVGKLIPDNEKSNLLFFKSNIISDENISIFNKNPLEIFEQSDSQFKEIEKQHIINIVAPEFVSVFDNKVEYITWLQLLDEILEYRKKFNQKMSELIHKGLLANTKKLSSEFTKWQKENPNKLEEFALKFNPLIEKLNLEVDIVNTEYSIPISNKKNEEVIPVQNTSTGTKGLLLSFLPLFKLDTKDAIILMDEPERSLYPDMQMDLIEHYQNLAPDAQFIIATHSPFIAASFEPEERFILYFDKEGKVAVRRGSSPIGDDPNDMLKNDFGVNYYNRHGEDAYKKYLSLKQAVANEKNPIKKKELLLETVKLGDAYNF